MRVALLAACTAVGAACGQAEDAAAPFVRFDADPASPTYGAVELVASDAVLSELEARARTAGWSSILAVHTEQAARDESTPAVLGDHAVVEGRLRFTPRFPPVPGQGYRVHAVASAGAAPLVIDTLVRVARAARPPATHVVQVHPAVDPLPANLLRLYIEFSAPMSRGEAWDRIRILDDDGEVVADALLVVPQELWDPARRRLTVLFDPGRIKTGVRANRELGLPLEAGGTYTLVIDDTWSDADGLPLREGFRRTFTVGPADRTLPSPGEWRIDPPAAGSREPLRLHLDEPLDWGLLHRLIAVHTSDGDRVAGTVAVSNDATRWTFTPASPWSAGGYVVRVRSDLEDLAGNTLRAPFDVDRTQPVEAAAEGDSLDLPFMVH